MFGEFPKLFDRDFVIAFFLPAAIFTTISLGLITGFNLYPQLPLLLKADLQGLTVLGLVAWLVGVLLLVLNYSIYRLLEGYGDYNPLRLLRWFEKRRYQKVMSEIAEVTAALDYGRLSAEDEGVLSGLRSKRSRLQQRRVEQFPRSEEKILPTAFGNAIKAFEDYPFYMYGADATVVWVRLIGVVPKEYRELIGSAKAQTDFWMNLWLLSYLLVIEYLFLAFYAQRISFAWFPLMVIGLAVIASRKARGAVIGWGDFVKSSYDLFLPELRTQIQLPAPANIDEERKLWTKFSQQVIYHRAQDVADRVPTRPEGKEEDLSDQKSKQAASK